ncbi:hypothetical protein MLD63_01410 (plasmid) [Paracoccus sp. TK19116]|uniref:Uncharacterized protein n=1 Tax=Paracoccus albicereus TaxID=2922394 RepID=A0ABT1MLD5_9RHOB|nr:hypothetical protein [Paracoccus albicereus]MCQ0969092.1 hypothetical protein [Paracoccus albicereus]
MIQTVQINGNFDRQDGTSAVSGELFFTLSKRDFDGATIVEPITQAVTLDADGAFAGVTMWPNDRGRSNSRYIVEYLPEGAARRELITKTMFVPEAGGPHELSDLLLAANLATSLNLDRVVRISSSDYDQRLSAGTLTDGLYLVEGA